MEIDMLPRQFVSIVIFKLEETTFIFIFEVIFLELEFVFFLYTYIFYSLTIRLAKYNLLPQLKLKV